MLFPLACRELKMSSRSQHYGFQSATVVQSANGGHAYLFGNASENDLSEEDGESYELRPRGRERLRRSTSKERLEDIIYLSRDIQEGDTLNSIALQYHCQVSLSLCVWCNLLFFPFHFHSPFISLFIHVCFIIFLCLFQISLLMCTAIAVWVNDYPFSMSTTGATGR